MENQTDSCCFQPVASFLLASVDLSPLARSLAREHESARFSLSHEIVTSRLLSGSQPFPGFTALKRSHRCTISRARRARRGNCALLARPTGENRTRIGSQARAGEIVACPAPPGEEEVCASEVEF